MSREKCRYLTAPSTDPDVLCLCAWGAESDASLVKLDGTPPWLQRLAAAGHMWRQGDCEVCPSYTPGNADVS